MPFTPKLPTWNAEVEVYKLTPQFRTYSLFGNVIAGQIYTPQRTQDEDMRDTQYFVYPKEKDFLRGWVDYGNIGLGDVIVFSFPINDPREVGFQVRVVQSRWLHFPNEHLMATLARLTPAELQLVKDGFPLNPPDSPTVVVTPYLRDPLLAFWVEGDAFDGVFVYGEYGQPGTAWNALYLELSAAENQLRDPAVLDYDAYHDAGWPGKMDAVALTEPTGAPAPSVFWVVTIATKELGGSAERKVAYLKRAKAEDAELILTTDGTGIPYPPNNAIAVSAASLEADGVMELNVTVTVRNYLNNGIAGLEVTLSAFPAGSIIATSPLTTDASGVVVFSVTNITVQNNVTYTANVTAFNRDIGPSDQVDWLALIPDAGESTIVAAPASVIADGVEDTTLTVTVLNVSGVPISGKTVTAAADSGSAAVTPASDITDGAGLAVFAATDTVVESGITFTANIAADAVDIGPSNPVDFITVPVLLTVAGVTNSLCANCTDLDVTDLVLPETSPGSNVWRSMAFAWGCVGGEVHWKLSHNAPSLTLRLLDATELETYVAYVETAAPGWNAGDAITIPFANDDGLNRCVWPASVDLT